MPTQRFATRPAESRFRVTSLAGLRPGFKLGAPIHDRSGRMLLRSGITITAAIREGLARYGVDRVIVSAGDLARLRAYQPQGTATTAPPPRRGIRADINKLVIQAVERSIGDVPMEMPEAADPFRNALAERRTCCYEETLAEDFIQRHEACLDDLTELFGKLASEQHVNLGQAAAMAHGALDMASEDLDVLACLAINPNADDYPGRHAVHAATLAMAIGIGLGLDRAALEALYVGCLVHDAAMLRVRESLLKQSDSIGDADFVLIANHPVVSLMLMRQSLEAIPPLARMVAYQIHERCDGSGYPRGVAADEIHPLSKVAAVADVFTALVASRPHREGMLPYYAMEYLIRSVGCNHLDGRAVRGLLDTVSLFPLGSFVELNDGRTGRSIRAQQSDYTRPLVEVRDPRQSGDAVAINLAEYGDLAVSRVLPPPQAA